MRRAIELAKRALARRKREASPTSDALPPHVVAHLEMAHWLVSDLAANADKWDDGWNGWLKREGGIVLAIENVGRLREPSNLRASFRLPGSERDWIAFCDDAQDVLIPAIERHLSERTRLRQEIKSLREAELARETLADWVACTKATPAV